MSIELNYIGHSAFYINSDNTGILIDPFISQNPVAKVTFDESSVEYIFVTHGHGDHLGDSIPIAKKNHAQIITIFELANYCIKHGATAIGAGLGGEIKFDWGTARFLPAFHSSSTPDGVYAGCPAGVLLDFNGLKIFHAGDTALNAEMKVIGEIYKPHVALLPIGSHYTMSVEDAAIAAKWLGVEKVVPMHYQTFDLINANVMEFKKLIEAQNQQCLIMTPGESIEIQ